MNGEVKVVVSTDMMTASITIGHGDEIITTDHIIAVLQTSGVNVGINREAIENLIKNEYYNTSVVVAEGKMPGKSVPGHLECFFDTSQMGKKTYIREDGTVQYSKYRAMVNKDARIAEYHPPKMGAFGYTVYSAVIAPPPVPKNMPECGKNVVRKDNSFFSKVDGEVIRTESELMVEDVLMIKGDAKYGMDEVKDFIGDVHVTGDVLSGVKISAKGNIIIDGTAEACELTSGKDIIIQGGIQGDMKALITAKGNITSPFIENATVVSEDGIYSDYVMNSKLFSGNRIRLYGKRGNIIGGSAVARNELMVDEVGNYAGVKTILRIENADYETSEDSRIIVNKKVHDNVRVTMNKVDVQDKIQEEKEYHMVDGNVQACEIGKYVPRPKPAPEEQKSDGRRTLLLVDDEPMVLRNYYQFLSEHYNVMLANSAKDARNQLELRVPDLILLDYRMPVMDGAEFLSSIRKADWKKYSQVPVIFVTAVSDKNTIIKCMKLYPQGYLIKPLGKNDLLNAVEKFFESIK